MAGSSQLTVTILPALVRCYADIDAEKATQFAEMKGAREAKLKSLTKRAGSDDEDFQAGLIGGRASRARGVSAKGGVPGAAALSPSRQLLIDSSRVAPTVPHAGHI